MASNNVLKLTLDDAEYAFVKSQQSGYLRSLVQREMGVGPETEKVVDKKESHANTLRPKSQPKEAGFCHKGHYAGTGAKSCSICGDKVY